MEWEEPTPVDKNYMNKIKMCFLLHLRLCDCVCVCVMTQMPTAFLCVFQTWGLCVCLSAAWICCSRNSVWLWRIACSSSTCWVITFRRSGCSWVSRDRTCLQTRCMCCFYISVRIQRTNKSISNTSELLCKYRNSSKIQNQNNYKNYFHRNDRKGIL